MCLSSFRRLAYLAVGPALPRTLGARLAVIQCTRCHALAVQQHQAGLGLRCAPGRGSRPPWRCLLRSLSSAPGFALAVGLANMAVLGLPGRLPASLSAPAAPSLPALRRFAFGSCGLALALGHRVWPRASCLRSPRRLTCRSTGRPTARHPGRAALFAYHPPHGRGASPRVAGYLYVRRQKTTRRTACASGNHAPSYVIGRCHGNAI